MASNDVKKIGRDRKETLIWMGLFGFLFGLLTFLYNEATLPLFEAQALIQVEFEDLHPGDQKRRHLFEQDAARLQSYIQSDKIDVLLQQFFTTPEFEALYNQELKSPLIYTSWLQQMWPRFKPNDVLGFQPITSPSDFHKRIRESLKIESVNDHFVIRVLSTDPSPKLANAVANTLATDLAHELNANTNKTEEWLQITQELDELLQNQKEQKTNKIVFSQTENGTNNVEEFEKKLLIQTEIQNRIYAELKQISETLIQRDDSYIKKSNDSKLITLYSALNKNKQQLLLTLPDSKPFNKLRKEQGRLEAKLSHLLKQKRDQLIREFDQSKNREQALMAQAQALFPEDLKWFLKSEKYYELFHKILNESSLEDYFLQTKAHILSLNTEPLSPSYPQKMFFLGLATGLGLIVGFLLDLLSNALRGRLHTSQQIKKDLGLSVLGEIKLS